MSVAHPLWPEPSRQLVLGEDGLPSVLRCLRLHPNAKDVATDAVTALRFLCESRTRQRGALPQRRLAMSYHDPLPFSIAGHPAPGER